ncbi:hypothetical protein [Bosea sp. (in: a-proteobacteria)]|uniref:hypothetical protein n=1 Tax=Bosea sp. (in: a-proteobacteria) TaxID=1871050 RepID=UPI001217D7FE|nr:hypothetical protein [Bosea sp. (in: a-proteobacteria)]TAJ34784.1 MAG: hypothetical protein EPO59_00830 [Bosea sp. (in: a-proteobacteria)]
MAQSTRATARLLDKTEAEFVERTQRAAIVTLSDQDLRELGMQLRQRRDKARDAARRQKREMRGKAEPRGARPASDNSGTKQKADALTGALKRIGAESTRRTEKERGPSQRSLARKALAAKQRQIARERPTNRTAGEGMRPIGNPKAAKSGALNDAGARPAMMRAKIARR